VSTFAGVVVTVLISGQCDSALM